MLENGEFIISINECNHWVKVEGAEFSSVPLLLIHGGPGGNHYVFERTTGKRLSEKRTVIYYEQRHCGRSSQVKDFETLNKSQLIHDIKQVQKYFNIEKIDLLGYSFGAELALNYTVEYPDNVRKIVLESPSLITLSFSNLTQLNGFLSIVSDEKRMVIESYLRQYKVEEAIAKTWQLVDSNEVDALLFVNNEYAAMNRRLWEESNLRNDGTFSKYVMPTMESEKLLHNLEALTHPILSLVGIYDKNTGIAINQLLNKHLKQMEVEYFISSAHFPDIEETKQFVFKVNQFLDESLG